MSSDEFWRNRGFTPKPGNPRMDRNPGTFRGLTPENLRTGRTPSTGSETPTTSNSIRTTPQSNTSQGPTPRQRKQHHRRGRGWYGRSTEQRARDNHVPTPPAQQVRRGAYYTPVAADPVHNFGDNRPTVLQSQGRREFSTHYAMMAMTERMGKTTTFIDPAKARLEMGKHSFKLIWDTGASQNGTPDESDFVGPIRRVGILRKLVGIASGVNIKGEGEVLWGIMDEYGEPRIIRVKAYLIPSLHTRLLATTSFLKSYKGETITLDEQKLKLSGLESKDCLRTPVTVWYNDDNNLPICEAFRPKGIETAQSALNMTVSEVNEDNINLNEAEKELLKWHQRLGHLGYHKIQFLLRHHFLCTPSMKYLHTTASKIKSPPKCTSCIYGKQCACTEPGHTKVPDPDHAGILLKGRLVAGELVATDHFVCSTLGRRFD